MKFNERLKLARETAGFTQEELAKKANVKQGTISKIERGDSDSSTFTVQLAVACGVNPEWLATGKGEMNTKHNHQVRESTATYGTSSELQEIPLRGRVPIISWAEAGNWRNYVDNFAAKEYVESILTTIEIKKYTYALRIQGDSMEPKFPAGSIVIIEPEEQPEHGKFIIVKIGDQMPILRQLIIEGGHFLKPWNNRYPIIELPKDAVFCGVAKQMTMDI